MLTSAPPAGAHAVTVKGVALAGTEISNPPRKSPINFARVFDAIFMFFESLSGEI